MMVNAQLYVKDLPGQLVKSLEPISLVNGNIVGVVHDREIIVNHRICVNVTFEIDNNKRLEQLKDLWKTGDVLIAEIGSVYKTFSMEYMLVGDFNAPFIEKLIDKASKNISFESVDVNYSSKNASSTRTAMLLVEVLSEDDMKKLDKFLMTECRKNKIVHIRGV